MTLTHTGDYTFDFETPYHCSVQSNCANSADIDLLLEIGSPFISDPSITIQWSGWKDDLSGISEFEYEVRQLIAYGETLDYGDSLDTVADISPSTTQTDYSLNGQDTGVYCILLTAVDTAGNHLVARKFVMYDSSTTITIGSDPLWIESASEETSREWQTNTEGDIVVKWTNHFYNQYHRDNKLLNAIADHIPEEEISAAYEDQTGQPPSTRSIEAIPNVNAIVKFDIQYKSDHKGGQTIGDEPAGSWAEVSDLESESKTLTVSRNDGDYIKIWVRATDVMGHTNQDSVSMYIDSTPPVISNVWLTKNGQEELAIHDSTDLFNMMTVFETYDDHSGLNNIHWKLYDMETLVTFGEGQIAVRKTTEDNCEAPNCGCIPKDSECYYRDYSITLDASKMNISIGTHDHDYIFQITATNNALLQTVEIFQITVDTSPPEEGHVSDSIKGEIDIDYQQETTVNAYWDGFFDRESGIFFYSYIFGTTCATADDFTIPTVSPAINTTSNHATFEAPGVGVYYCTVVAYNRAIEPCEPVCSDGVTIDDSLPEINSVVVDTSVTFGGIVKGSTENVYIIDRTRYKYPIENPSQECLDIAASTDDIGLWADGTENITYGSSDCLSAGTLKEFSYITSENMLKLEWEGYDKESGIFDYEVGLSRTNTGLNPDLLGYSSTNSHTEFKSYHPDLAEGVTFYIFVKAINRAKLEVTKVIGPFSVDTTPPQFTGEIRVTYEDDQNINYLVARWDTDAFYEEEDQDLLSYEVAIGDAETKTNILSFTSLEEYQIGVCYNRSGERCAAVSVDELDWSIHGNHQYYFTVRVINVAGLSTVASSPVYTHVSSLPSMGYILEVLPHEDDKYNVNSDTDYQTSTSEIHTIWYGFSHPYLDVKFDLGLGSSPGSDDVVNFFNVGSDTSYTLTGLSLEYFKTYYVIIIASNEVGSVNTSSDGVTILSEGGILSGVTVLDGPGCSNIDTNPSDTSKFTHHSNYTFACKDELEFQPSTSSVQCHWDISEEETSYITQIEWALEVEETLEGITSWNIIYEHQNYNMTDEVHAVDLQLQSGQHYRSSVKFCHSAGCFESKTSDGFFIITEPPYSSGIESISYNETTRDLEFSWEEFVNLELTDLNTIDFCEWALVVKTTESPSNGDFLKPWRKIDASFSSDSMMFYTVNLEDVLLFTECIQLRVRCYNKVGMYSEIFQDVRDCNVFGHVTANEVIDAVGEWNEENNECKDITLEENALWEISDKEYSMCKNKISAVWPNLRHGYYIWTVVQNDDLDALAYVWSEHHNMITTYDCGNPLVIACGQTTNNFINVDDLTLDHGKRYYVCVHANETTLEFENSNIFLPAISVCSDGITVDHTPPTAGNVWLGFDEQFYQTTISELLVRWESFIDVEENGKTSHVTSIRNYEYAIGTYYGGNDVVDFTSVGITNEVVVHKLLLQSGLTYYATVRATDYVGLTTEATSSGVTVDMTPPSLSNQGIDIGGRYHKSTSEISASWENLFSDPESGIVGYKWGLGSFAGHADIMPFTDVLTERATSAENVDLELREGHVYYVSVRAYNGAGLSSLAISWPFTVEVSPPVEGLVYDGENSTDQDYQTDLTTIKAHWEGFKDPHTAVIDYAWGVGNCKGCYDILKVQHVGLLTEVSTTHLNLKAGWVYYVTVTACNAADLCTTVFSDGIIPDNSPPVAGVVYDGPTGEDIGYQASRTSIATHWLSFVDPHSRLSHYEWFAGTSPGSSDVMERQSLHLSDMGFINELSAELPVDTHIYITVGVYNKAGMYSERSSDGFVVDDTAPVVIRPTSFDQTKGSFYNNTQIWRTVITVNWEIVDKQSPITEYLVSIITHHQSENDVGTVKISGQASEYTFTGLSLSNGDTYYAKVIACNAAKLCTESVSEGILVDSTSPTVGTFAAESDHAAMLSREVLGWMIYSQSQGSQSAQVHLAWLGFADLHSGISLYYVTVGTEYNTRDLTQGGPVSIEHDGESQHSSDEGLIQTSAIDIDRDLVNGEYIYISIWGVNGAGLHSYEAHETFEVVKSNNLKGLLSLVRRCDSQSCEGHCTCAPQNQVCSSTSDICSDVNGDASYQQVEVIDVVNYRFDGDFLDENYTSSQCTLAAKWKLLSGGIAVKRFEWSAGRKGKDPGTGVLDLVNDRIWHDNGLGTEYIFALDRGDSDSDGFSLLPYLEYVFYVKAWYDDNSFAIFQSDGIMTDYIPPQISSVRKVKDIVAGAADVDYITQTNPVSIYWKNMFTDDEIDIAYYQVAIGTTIGVDDISPYTSTVVSYDVYNTTLNGLDLLSGPKYYASVRAFNYAGLQATVSSDGFIVDTRKPIAGVVHDGVELHDVNYQTSTSNISASWFGFVDLESGTDHYIWCVGSSSGAEDIVPCYNVGLQNRLSYELSAKLDHGDQYFSKVIAVDAAGWESDVVISDGVTVDITAPVPEETIEYGDNILGLNNPSFEVFDSEDDIAAPTSWVVLEGTAEVFTSDNFLAADGSSYLQLYGSISLNFSTEIGQRYRLTFYASHMFDSNVPVSSQEGIVQAPGLHQVFQLYQRVVRFDSGHHHTNDSINWHKQIEYFTAGDLISTITFSSIGDKSGLLLDNVIIQKMTAGSTDTGAIHLHTIHLFDWHSVQASWSFIDNESPIVEYLWAIGTVQGGTQIQGFTSVEKRTYAENNDLALMHGSNIYITVMAINAAGLSTIEYSDSVLVDLTPPEICCLKDGLESKDLQYQTTGNISIQFEVTETESGLDYCEWAIGLSLGSEELQSFVRIEGTTKATVDLSSRLKHGHVVYSTLKCHNFVGLSSMATTDGVIIVNKSPAVDVASVRFISTSPSHYPVVSSFQAQNSSLTFTWDGFSDPSGIEYYEFFVEGPGTGSEWLTVGSHGEQFVSISELNLVNQNSYTIGIRAINLGGFISSTVYDTIIIDSLSPVINDSKVDLEWLSSDTLVINWTDSFSSYSSLFYEIIVGSIADGSGILKLAETTDTSLTVTKLNGAFEHYVTITAINSAGLYTTFHKYTSL